MLLLEGGFTLSSSLRTQFERKLQQLLLVRSKDLRSPSPIPDTPNKCLAPIRLVDYHLLVRRQLDTRSLFRQQVSHP